MQNICRKPAIKIVQVQIWVILLMAALSIWIHMMLCVYLTMSIYLFAFEAIIWHNWSSNMKIKPNISHDFEIDPIKILNMETTILLPVLCEYFAFIRKDAIDKIQIDTGSGNDAPSSAKNFVFRKLTIFNDSSFPSLYLWVIFIWVLGEMDSPGMTLGNSLSPGIHQNNRWLSDFTRYLRVIHLKWGP